MSNLDSYLVIWPLSAPNKFTCLHKFHRARFVSVRPKNRPPGNSAVFLILPRHCVGEESSRISLPNQPDLEQVNFWAPWREKLAEPSH
jgi:hypothetical protein